MKVKRFGITFARRRKAQGLLLMAPWIVGFLAFTLYPIAYSLYLSFHQVFITPLGIRTAWAGFANFQRALFIDPDFMTRLLLFVRFLVLAVPIVVVFALFMAMLINRPLRGRGFFRALFFLPVIITSGEVVSELFSQGVGSAPLVSQYGVVEYIQHSLPPFFAEPLTAIISQLIIMLWYSGVQILIFLAGLQKVNVSVYEAASIDGASPWEAFWKITLPYLKPFILINTIYTIVTLCTSTVNTIIELIRVEMFKITTGFGYASSVAWLYFTAIFILIGAVALLFGRGEDGASREERKARRARRRRTA